MTVWCSASSIEFFGGVRDLLFLDSDQTLILWLQTFLWASTCFDILAMFLCNFLAIGCTFRRPTAELSSLIAVFCSLIFYFLCFIDSLSLFQWFVPWNKLPSSSFFFIAALCCLQWLCIFLFTVQRVYPLLFLVSGLVSIAEILLCPLSLTQYDSDSLLTGNLKLYSLLNTLEWPLLKLCRETRFFAKCRIFSEKHHIFSQTL